MNWNELLILMEQAPDFAQRVLHKPCKAAQIQEETFLQLDQAAKKAGLESLLRRHIFSAIATGMRLKNRIFNTCIKSCTSMGECLSSASPDISNEKWICFPVITCRSHFCSTTWFLAGRIDPASPLTHKQTLFTENLEPETVRALKHAVSASSAYIGSNDPPKHLYAFMPIIGSRYGMTETVSGKSLGLPAALALILMDMGRAWPQNMLATGGIDEQGRVLAVSMAHIKEEYAAGIKAALLCPEPDGGLCHANPASNKHPHNTLQCRTLSQAANFILLASGKTTARDILLASACLEDPELFLRHFPELPATVNMEIHLPRISGRIADAPHTYLDAFATCLARLSDAPERAAPVADIFTPGQLAGYGMENPSSAISAFRAVTARIALHGHRGSVRKMQPWLKAAETLKSAAGGTVIAEYFNQQIAASYHNRFNFTPGLPEEFAHALAVEEQVMKLRHEKNWLLGAMHGTAAQNYGFCGPLWLHRVEEHVARGRDAFGEIWPEDSARLVNYLVYALLDADDMDRATFELMRYLEIVPNGSGALSQIVKALSNELNKSKADSSRPFRIALVIRFLADSCLTTASLRNAAEQLMFEAFQENCHPWQLITLNAGRIMLQMNETQKAQRYFQRSLEICMEGGTTMNIMALLPLSCMHAADMDMDRLVHDTTAPVQSADEAVEHVVALISDPEIVKTGHFRELVEAGSISSQKVLEKVSEQPERWFPFSYR